MDRNDELMEKLHQDLPAAFGRTAVEKLLPGIITSKTLANLGSAGLGPNSYRHGKKVFYEKDAFLDWLSQRVRRIEGGRS